MEEKKVKKKGKVKKYLLIGLVTLIVLSIPAHFMWKYSGSNQWKLYYDVDTIKVWTKKIPGETWTQFKTYNQLRGSMRTIIRFIRDPRAAEDAGCYDGHMIDSINPNLMYYTFKQKFFWPFKPREYVVVSNFTQDSITKDIYTDFICVPDKIPLDPSNGCYRVPKVNNQWRFHSIGKGKVEYYFETNSIDPGGNFPYFVANPVMLQIFKWSTIHMQEILDKKDYTETRDQEYVKNVD